MSSYSPITPYILSKAKLAHLDFTAQNPKITSQNPDNTEAFSEFIFEEIKSQNADVGVGGWLEERLIYGSREQFNLGKSRNIHLGVDIWLPAETPLFAIEDCKIHSFANNLGFGNYGPTLILESLTSGLFYLHGHLSLDSIENKKENDLVKSGQQIGKIGNYPINGDWPPHLHFQVMNTMLGKTGDFPGVCAKSELKTFKKICLDPNPFLGIVE